MNILITTDSFKDGANSEQLCKAIERGILASSSNWNTRICPLADGGEGTSLIINSSLGGEWIKTSTVDPLNRPIQSWYSWVAEEQLAVIELAQASGIQNLKPSERNPMHTTTFGTGILIRHALEKGARHITLCIGSSATNDLAMGLAAAIGYKFYAGEEWIKVPRGRDLNRITKIVDDVHLDNTTFTILCDVKNPLYGPQGAAHIYGPQKGASEEEVHHLDAGLKHMANLIGDTLGIDIHQVEGGGAAGGVGAGGMVFLNAELKLGIEAVKQLLKFDEAVKWADLLITGEGRLDQQTFNGKLIKGVIQSAQMFDKPVIALCGEVALSQKEVYQLGLASAFSVSNGIKSEDMALANTLPDIEFLSTQLANILMLNN